MRLRRTLAWCGIVLVLVAVFSAYLRPEMAMTLATQLWNCF
jgi:type II secretory pathway component PulM